MEENDGIVYVIQPCGHKKATGERRRALYFIFPIIHNNIQHESSGGSLWVETKVEGREKGRTRELQYGC